MGFRREARMAGATPKTIPTEAETKKARRTDQTVTSLGKKRLLA